MGPAGLTRHKRERKIDKRASGWSGMCMYVRVRNHAYLGLWRLQEQAAAHVWLSAWQR